MINLITEIDHDQKSDISPLRKVKKKMTNINVDVCS